MTSPDHSGSSILRICAGVAGLVCALLFLTNASGIADLFVPDLAIMRSGPTLVQSLLRATFAIQGCGILALACALVTSPRRVSRWGSQHFLGAAASTLSNIALCLCVSVAFLWLDMWKEGAFLSPEVENLMWWNGVAQWWARTLFSVFVATSGLRFVAWNLAGASNERVLALIARAGTLVFLLVSGAAFILKRQTTQKLWGTSFMGDARSNLEEIQTLLMFLTALLVAISWSFGDGKRAHVRA